MITSLANGRIKQLNLLREKSRARNKEGLFLAEGIKMFEEAPIEKMKEVYYAESFEKYLVQDKVSDEEQQNKKETDARSVKICTKIQECRERGILVEVLSDEVFKKTADTQTPQGILFVMEQLHYSVEEMVINAKEQYQATGKEPLFLLLEDIQDPGNLGTIVRTGEGAGVNGIIMSKGTVDIYNPKTIRSTMGSLYRVPFVYVEDLAGAMRQLQKAGITVYAAHLAGEKYHDELSYEGGSAFLIGNEGNGLRRETADQADTYLKIPMEGQLESLNAAVAAALLLYQAAGSARKRTIM